MLWVYVMLTTAGVVAIVPTVLRALEGHDNSLVTGFVGFVGFFGGLAGLVAQRATSNGWAVLISAAAMGLAAGALHPEILAGLRDKKKIELTHDQT